MSKYAFVYSAVRYFCTSNLQICWSLIPITSWLTSRDGFCNAGEGEEDLKAGFMKGCTPTASRNRTPVFYFFSVFLRNEVVSKISAGSQYLFFSLSSLSPPIPRNSKTDQGLGPPVNNSSHKKECWEGGCSFVVHLS